MLRNNLLTIAGLLLATIGFFSMDSLSVLADFSLRDWRYAKTVTLPAGLQQESLVEIVPEREVFAGSAYGLVDLRIIADGGTEVPYKLEVSKAEHQRTSFPVALRDKGYIPGQYTSFTADLGRTGILHNEIEFQAYSTNFRRTAVVEASNDGTIWAKVTEQTVYDFTVKERNFTTRNTRVRYPDNTARYLRVKIADEGEGSLQIGSASVFYMKETLAREIPWPATILGTSRDTDQGTTLVEVDLATPGVPSYRLAIKVPEVNFHRGVTLQASADREAWRTILSRSEIYAYDTPKFVGSNLVITYPETTFRYLRLSIYDEDSPPLSVQGVDVWGLRRRLVFSANPNYSYQLYYGNLEARQPYYDIERVFPYLVTEELPEAKLAPQ
ncbi:MAG: DUF3999 family protein, partial [Chloroflexi bacterium]|nr:DUF3999 family protein [Chloroflexota bacterium]